MATTFEKILNTAEKAKAITPCGKDYLEMALNPFPNDEVRAVGYPDGTRGRSIVRVVNETFSVAAPAGLVGAYDLHVFSFPEACATTFALFDSQNHVRQNGPNAWLQSDGVTPVQIGLFNIFLVPAGYDTLPSASAGAVTLPVGSAVWTTNYSGYCAGPTRVIAGGFKVVSTSPTIYEGGGSVLYRKASQATDAVFHDGMGQLPIHGTSVRQFTAPPGSVQAATLIPGCVTGKARDGAYVPLIFRDIGVARPCRYNITMVMPSDEPNALEPTWLRYRYAAGVPVPNTDSFTAGGLMPCVKETASDICGAYFTGVSNEGTFTVTTRAVLQTFPTITDPDLTLARLSPDNDPVALDVYRRITDEMHVAGIASSNHTGSWWREICKVGVAASALIPNPMFARAIAGTLPVLAGIADLTLGNSSRRAVGAKRVAGNGSRR
jgi:hypothetical protein